MKKAIVLIVFVSALLAAAQEKFTMTVKDSQTVSGVVIVDIQVGGKPAELQCNQGGFRCEQLKRGSYQMVKLPKNRGYYDCQNVEVYEQSADTEKDKAIGAYCLNEK